jgi:hypothetical protein
VAIATKLMRDNDVNGRHRNERNNGILPLLSSGVGYYHRRGRASGHRDKDRGEYLSSLSLATQGGSFSEISKGIRTSFSDVNSIMSDGNSETPLDIDHDQPSPRVLTPTPTQTNQRTLLCIAYVCESIVSVTPAINYLGECNVGDFKVNMRIYFYGYASIYIYNE